MMAIFWKRNFLSLTQLLVIVGISLKIVPVWAYPPGEGPALTPRITQDMVESSLSHKAIRQAGHRIFSTPFNLFDGLGDGPINPADPVSPGGRPTLQNNGMFLRMNGLDSQSCLECHSVRSNATIPAQFAVGGFGGAAANAMPGVTQPDVSDEAGNGFAAIQGRFINPPFSFGSGGVELLAKEMTADLQALKAVAENHPGEVVHLLTKGVSFGSIMFQNGQLDTSKIEGIDGDLVVRPFGRKGCCFSVRNFDTGAMQFHHGIQPVEVVGEGVDADGDGVENELLVGELSALHIFQASLKQPVQSKLRRKGRRGRALFHTIGCAGCHIPVLRTESRWLPIAFPENPKDPWANVFFEIDLSKQPGFKAVGDGVRVPLYADLKRHDMGPGLAESTGGDLDPFFTTARLWGVADTAPYLHDGRALTLTQAIRQHGGEALAASNNFEKLSNGQKKAILTFLRSLRTPRKPSSDLQ